MTVTIKDVALRANVAPSTVSRVLGDHPKISEATKRKVKRAMQDLNYHPNLNARSLANRTSNSIGLIVPEASERFFYNPFFSEVLKGISDCAQQEDYSLYFATGGDDTELFSIVEKMVKGKRVDGMILLNAKVSDSVLEYLSKNKFPTILLGQTNQSATSVTTVDSNNYFAGRDAANYLINQGHKNIGFVGGSKTLMVTQDRNAGIRDALLASNIPINDNYFFLNIINGDKIADSLISLSEMPTGLIVMDDLLALEVIESLHEKGIRIPEDISVISFNNSYLCNLSLPRLTSIDINTHRLGYEAARACLESIRDENMYSKQILITHSIIERKSVKTIKQ